MAKGISKKTRESFDAEQTKSFRASALALVFAVIVLGAGYSWLPPEAFGLSRNRTIGEQIAFALQADLLLFIWLAWCVRAVSRAGFHSSADKVPAVILQNSLEQTILAFGAHLILATVLRGSELVLIPLLVALYLVGRLAFSLGYRRSKPCRAFGMALTAAPTDASLMLAAALMIAGR